MHQAREYQQDVIDRVYAAWQTARNVAVVLPTGGGKTFIFSRIAAAAQGSVVAIAHRSELVAQMSLALAREGVPHRVQGPAHLVRQCTDLCFEELQANYITPNAPVSVASVDSLRARGVVDPQVRLWITDECHHVLRGNKWGKACEMFPNAIGLGVTATLVRADRKGLGRHADGLFDAMVVGPTMRHLIGQGFLTEYRVFAPPSDLDLSDVPVTGSGDYSPERLRAARRRSHITGDVVEHYLRIAPGKLGVTFEVDIESARETLRAFQNAGVSAELVTGESSPVERARVLRAFKERKVLQLINVDLFGEGFDLPAIEVVSMARPTQSYGLFCQQFGRALRPMDGKTHAIIIDHVGNTVAHGLPDAPRAWSLDRGERRPKSTAATDVIPTRVCAGCTGVYERIYRTCPYCGVEPVPAGRSAPEQVDGDLLELDADALARLRGEVDRIDRAPAFPQGVSPAVAGAIKKHHWSRQQAQVALRETIALWSGWQSHLMRPASEQYRRFFHRYGTDVATAQTLGEADAAALGERITIDLDHHNVRAA